MTLNKVLTRLIWACVIPLVVVAAFLTVLAVTNGENARQREAANITEDLNVAIDQYLSSRVSALQMLAGSPLMDDPADRKDLYREAQGFYENFGSHVVLADTDSHMLLNTRVPFGTPLPPLPRPRGHAAAPTALKTGKPAIGDTFPGPIAKETLVAIAVPVRRDGRNVLVLLTTFEARRFSKFLDRVTLPSGWVLTLLDGRNATIVRRSVPAQNKARAADHVHFFVAKSSVSPWSVVLEISPEAYWRPLIEAGVFLSAIVLCAALASVLGGLRAGRRIGRAVASLADSPGATTPATDITEIAAVRRALDDISEKRDRADAVRRAGEQRWSTTLSSIGDAVVTCDAEGRVTFLNPAAERLIGWTMEESRDRPVGEVLCFIDEKTREPGEDIVAGVLRERRAKVPARDMVLVTKDGREVPIEDSAAPIPDAAGELLGVVLVFRDVTERRRARQALMKSEEQYRLLFVANPNPMFLFDEDTYRFLAVNDSAIHHYGWSREEFLGLSILDIRPEEERMKAEEIIRKFRGARETLVGTVHHRRKDGAVRDVKVTASSIMFEGRPARLCSLLDVTEQNRAEEEKALLESQLAQAQKMEAVGTLAGGVAHDFNNMLSVILGYSELVMNALGEGTDLYAHIAEVRKAAERSADITRQLLAFARKQTISPRVLDLNDTVEGVLKMLRRLIGENIDLKWVPGARLWSVKMDPSQVDQVLANLMVNARDAIADTGKISIETGNATIDDQYCEIHAGFTPGDFVVLSVSDDGRGMDKETAQKIFEPFFTTKRAGEGTGLGLATVYGIVKQNEGFINVYSEPGHGTTFKIYLPRRNEATVAVEHRDDVPLAMGRGETVLVVEDEAAILALAERFLTDLSYKVLTAESPEKALDIAAGHPGPIHLLMTDVVMPGMNGRELSEELRKSRPDLKLLFMSGYTANAIAHRGVLDEGVRFVQKPFSLYDLAAKVRGVIEHQE